MDGMGCMDRMKSDGWYDRMGGDGWMVESFALCSSELHAPEGTLCRSSFTLRWAGWSWSCEVPEYSISYV